MYYNVPFNCPCVHRDGNMDTAVSSVCKWFGCPFYATSLFVCLSVFTPLNGTLNRPFNTAQQKQIDSVVPLFVMGLCSQTIQHHSEK